MGAIYEAIRQVGISYVSVPASFEERGQRVRLCGEVLSMGMGCCLDLACLYSSCLEGAGLHPIIVLVKGHAFAGCHLVQETFADTVNDDVSILTKKASDGISEVMLVETTALVLGKSEPFDSAVSKARKYLLERGDEFICSIDIRRARLSHIRPLPLRTDGGIDTEAAIEGSSRTWEAPKDVSSLDLVDPNTPESVGKLNLWERKLLDLSLRNNLLNSRMTRDTIQVMSSGLSTIEDKLSAGKDFQICPMLQEYSIPQTDSKIFPTIKEADSLYGLVRSEVDSGRLHSYLDEDRTKAALKHLYRSSRLAMEESGANTLYLAIGMLRWYETSACSRPHYAPVLLYPVELVRRSAQSSYVLRGRDEDVSMNITLLEMLRQFFGIRIGGLDPLPRDSSGIDVSRVFSTIRQGIMDRKGWDIEEHAIIGIFSFSKFVMWNDIHNHSDVLRESPIVSSLIDGVVDERVLSGEEGKAVEDIRPGEIALPISADSSQLEAIQSAMQGRSFILHGPPGTGKSQTITNIIANALVQGQAGAFRGGEDGGPRSRAETPRGNRFVSILS